MQLAVKNQGGLKNEETWAGPGVARKTSSKRTARGLKPVCDLDAIVHMYLLLAACSVEHPFALKVTHFAHAVTQASVVPGSNPVASLLMRDPMLVE